MKSFTMMPAPTIVFGEGEALKLSEHLKKLGANKVAVVYDPGVFKAGLIGPVLDALEIPYITCDKIEPESPDTAVQAVKDALYGQGVDAVVAIGGGSCIDTTRTAMLLSETDEPVTNFFTKFPEKTADHIKYICIPTTAGTGAEMSPGGPIYNTKTKVKGAMFCGFKMTDMVILDPTLTVGLPPFTSYTCAMDAMCHALEAMTGNLRNAMTDMIAGQAIKLVWEALPIVMDENPKDLDARGKLQLASNMAIGCQSLRHLGHAVCQPIGGKFHLAHGYTCALVLPATIECYADEPSIAPVWKLVGQLLGLDSENPAHELAIKIDALNKKYGIKPLAENGISLDEALSCTEQILGDGRLLPNCPRPVTREDVEFAIKCMCFGIKF